MIYCKCCNKAITGKAYRVAGDGEEFYLCSAHCIESYYQISYENSWGVCNTCKSMCNAIHVLSLNKKYCSLECMSNDLVIDWVQTP